MTFWPFWLKQGFGLEYNPSVAFPDVQWIIFLCPMIMDSTALRGFGDLLIFLVFANAFPRDILVI
jgi:hypothetical protein